MSQREAIDSPAIDFSGVFDTRRGSKGAQPRWCCPRAECHAITLRNEARCRGCNLPQNCFAATIEYWRSLERNETVSGIQQGGDLNGPDPRRKSGSRLPSLRALAESQPGEPPVELAVGAERGTYNRPSSLIPVPPIPPLRSGPEGARYIAQMFGEERLARRYDGEAPAAEQGKWAPW